MASGWKWLVGNDSYDIGFEVLMGVTMKSMAWAEHRVVWRESIISEKHTAQSDTCFCWFVAWLTV
jgi:hypothetical protein